METLKQLDRWCGCNGKLPINPKTGNYCKSNDINTFSSYGEATEKYDDVGFLICTSNDTEKFVGLDLDHVIKDGETEQWALDVLDMIDSYTEISTSGTGYHIICRGEIKDDIVNSKLIKDEDNQKLEICGYGTGARYYKLTFNTWQNRDTVKDISQETLHKLYRKFNLLKTKTTRQRIDDYISKLSDAEVIQLLTQKPYSKACKLWRGESVKGDNSVDEAALVMYLLYYCGGDTVQVERLMYQSGWAADEDRLAKWDKKHSSDGRTYLQLTIDNAYNEWDGSMHSMQRTYNIQSDECYFDAYIDDITNVNNDYIPTCYPELNNLLGGGLYTGLYVIGAVSSLGKTTFALQLCDSLQRDVLVISLEMSRAELMSKRISRMTAEVAIEKNNMQLAKTVREISNGRLYSDYTDEEKEVIAQQKQIYREQYASHIYTVEGDGTIGIAEVKQIAAQLTEQLGHAPVILIDYLQILAPTNARGTDKQNIDMAISGCKTLSRDLNTPVIVISSSNRASYNGKASLASFKESGTIEYSADVAIALTFSGAGESSFDESQARREKIRDITLTVLKNRNGALGDVMYRFYAPYNYFAEVEMQSWIDRHRRDR